MKKIRVGVLFGGRSAEHEVSLQSARNVLEALDRDKYEPFLIGIDREGRWRLDEQARVLFDEAIQSPRAGQILPELR
jgi:D-alanine-D-alanine ligase